MDTVENDLRQQLHLRAAHNAPDAERSIASALAIIGRSGKRRRWIASTLVAAAVVAILVIAGAVLGSNRQPVGPAGQLPVNSKAELVNTTWEAVSYRTPDGPVVELQPASRTKANFSPRAVSMPEWCNAATAGPWDVDDGSIDVEGEGWTRSQVACFGGTPPPAEYNTIVNTRHGVLVFLTADKQTMTLRFGGGEVELRRIQ